MVVLSKKQLSIQDYDTALQVCKETRIGDLLRTRRFIEEKKLKVSDTMKKALDANLDKRIADKDFSY